MSLTFCLITHLELTGHRGYIGGMFILDSGGKLLIFRSCCKDGGLQKLHKAFVKEADEFVKRCTTEKDSEIEGNRRGFHWFCIAGYDRQIKSVQSLPLRVTWASVADFLPKETCGSSMA